MEPQLLSSRVVKSTAVKNIHSEFIITEKSKKTVEKNVRTSRRNKVDKHVNQIKSLHSNLLDEKLNSQAGFQITQKTTNLSSEKQILEKDSHISHNEKRQLIEDAKAAANGSCEVSALELYKKSGRYWDVYPKTDWTYSLHSQDRVELAPGVVAMPNMSRRTIHTLYKSNNTSDSDYHHTQINKELLTNSNYNKRYNSSHNFKYSNYKNYYSLSRWRSWVENVIIFFLPLSIFSQSLEVQTLWLAKLHLMTSRIMLFDTWLLWKAFIGNKSNKLLALCLIPLFLLGGCWTFLNFGSILRGIYINSTSASIFFTKDETNKDKFNLDYLQTPSILQDEFVKNTDEIPMDSSLTKKLTKDQLELLSNYVKNLLNDKIDTNYIIESIIQNSDLQNMLREQAHMETKNFIKEIEFIKQEMNDQKTRDEKLLILQNKKLQDISRLTYQLKRCCRISIADIENSVKHILTSLLNDEEFIQKLTFNKNIHDNFATKNYIQSLLFENMENVENRYSDMMMANNKLLIDEIFNKIKNDLNEEIRNIKLLINNKQVGTSHGYFDSDEHVKKIVKNMLAVYDADKTGLVDYAIETMGGQILTTRCTENYKYGKAVVSILGVPLWYPVNSPRTIITPSINPGECWAFQNFPGFVVIQLSSVIEVQAFSMEHISKMLVPEGKIDSAPNEFEVYGLKSENDKEPVKLGQYIYDFEGEPLQFFMVQDEGHVFGIIELRIISNHGNPNYTCLYRFRVHGKPNYELT